MLLVLFASAVRVEADALLCPLFQDIAQPPRAQQRTCARRLNRLCARFCRHYPGLAFCRECTDGCQPPLPTPLDCCAAGYELPDGACTTACGACGGERLPACPTPSLSRQFGPNMHDVAIWGYFSSRSERCFGGVFSGPVTFTDAGVGSVAVTGACTGTLRAVYPYGYPLSGLIAPLVLDGALSCACCGDLPIDAQL